jgi:GNAT superfamily N-acetyltransferase
LTSGRNSWVDMSGDHRQTASRQSAYPLSESAVKTTPATTERWPDLQQVFGPNGAFAGCWCIWPRLRSKDFQNARAADNKARLKALVDAPHPPGIIAYLDGEPVGWCAVDRRQNFAMLEHSRVYKRLDDEPVWTIICFVIRKGYRRRGVMAALLQGAIEHVRAHGGRIIEAYPIEPEGDLKSYQGYTGIVSTFRKAGFEEAARLSNGRPVMRYYLA